MSHSLADDAIGIRGLIEPGEIQRREKLPPFGRERRERRRELVAHLNQSDRGRRVRELIEQLEAEFTRLDRANIDAGRELLGFEVIDAV